MIQSGLCQREDESQESYQHGFVIIAKKGVQQGQRQCVLVDLLLQPTASRFPERASHKILLPPLTPTFYRSAADSYKLA